MRFIKEPQVVILCVIEAGFDFGPSEGLKLARKVDPKVTHLCSSCLSTT